MLEAKIVVIRVYFAIFLMRKLASPKLFIFVIVEIMAKKIIGRLINLSMLRKRVMIVEDKCSKKGMEKYPERLPSRIAVNIAIL